MPTLLFLRAYRKWLICIFLTVKVNWNYKWKTGKNLAGLKNLYRCYRPFCFLLFSFHSWIKWYFFSMCLLFTILCESFCVYDSGVYDSGVYDSIWMILCIWFYMNDSVYMILVYMIPYEWFCVHNSGVYNSIWLISLPHLCRIFNSSHLFQLQTGPRM